MSSELTRYTFVLVGPNAGKTLRINGRDFVEGRMTMVEPACNMAGAVKVYGEFHSAFLEGSAEHLAAVKRYKEASDGQRQVQEGAVGNSEPAVHGGVQPDGRRPGPEAPAVVGGAGDPATGTAPGMAGGGGSEGTEAAERDKVKRIGEALQKLESGNPEHWGQDGQPSVEHVSRLVGYPVSRAEIASVSDRTSQKSNQSRLRRK